MAKALNYLYLFLAGLLTWGVVWVNLQLYTPAPPFPGRKEEVVRQLNYLSHALKKEDAGTQMQYLFPEGFVFLHALYGLSWCELALALPREKALGQRAAQEALYAYGQINSQEGRSTFPENMTPAYGIFYHGWRNYLLAKLLQLPVMFPERASCLQEFKSNCAAIAKAMRQSSSPFLESYPSQAWPADMFAAVASLRIYDQLYGPVYTQELARWIGQVKERLDPATGLLPHKAEAGTGTQLERARGGSMALMLRLLVEIDPVFAREEYARFQHHFVTTVLGLPAVREYPKGTAGVEDIDSGPVILGVGFPATLVSIGTFQVFGEEELSQRQFQTVHAFGWATSTASETFYLWGQLPLADAFIAWSRATGHRINPVATVPANHFWRMPFHLISAFILLVFWLLFLKMKRIAVPAKEQQSA